MWAPVTVCIGPTYTVHFSFFFLTFFYFSLSRRSVAHYSVLVTFNPYEKFIFSTRQNVREDPWDVNVISHGSSSHSHIIFASNIFAAHINHAYVSNQFGTVNMQTMPLNFSVESHQRAAFLLLETSILLTSKHVAHGKLAPKQATNDDHHYQRHVHTTADRRRQCPWLEASKLGS
jgi:hypothetical protein